MKLLHSLKNIDIVDLNYSMSYFSSSSDNLSKPNRINNVYSISLFAIKQVVKDLLCVLKNRNIKDKNLFFYSSVNQYNALSPLHEKIEDSVFVNLSHKTDTRLPMGLGCLISIILAPRFHFILNREYKNKKHVISNNYVDYFFIEGMYLWWSLYLKIKKPKLIIFSNDHLVWHRVLRKAAEINKVPAIYLQHASVTEKFPKLEFDLSLLEGKDAFNKYSKKGISGEVELVGMPKFDKYYSYINKRNKVITIGICVNMLDNETYIEKLCSSIHSSFNYLEIILRPHPRDSRHNFFDLMKKKYNVHLSDSTKENAFKYLKKVDVNIAGESSIHLEAALLNVYPIYFQFNDKRLDHYGYLKNKLVVDVFDNTNELNNFLNNLKNNKPNIRARAKYYINTVNSEYDGKSAELAKNKIININFKK
jgi:hypothetical protein